MLDEELRVKRSVRQSFLRGLRINGCLRTALAVFPLILLPIAFIYLELITKTFCRQWEHKNHSIPLSVVKWRLVGAEIEDIVLNPWFPVVLALLLLFAM